MKKLIKRKRVLVILAIVAGLVITRIFLFESVHLHSYLRYFADIEKYEKYFLFEGKVRRTHRSFSSSYIQEDEYILMFQWQYDKMVEELQKELYDRLDNFVEKYEFVSAYKVNEQRKVIDIYYDKQREEAYSNQVNSNAKGLNYYYGLESVAEGRIEIFCQMQAFLMKSDDWYMVRLHDTQSQNDKE